MVHGQVGVTSEAAAIDHRRNADDMRWLHVTPGAGHHPQHLGLAWHHYRASSGGGQHQLLAALGVIVSKLLGQGAAPGHADDVDLAVVEVVEHPRGQLGQPREAVRVAWRRRAADPGHIEGDDFQVRVKCIDEREHQLEVGADAVEDQQRRQVRLAGANSGADGLVVQLDGPENIGLRHARDSWVK
ncbi:hypothetical protein D3C80_1150140 [compost metagenome]